MKPIQGTILAVLFILALAVPTSAWAQIPVSCGDTLSIPGGQYKLYADLNCVGLEYGLKIVADDVDLNLAGHTMTGTLVGPWCLLGFVHGPCGILVQNASRVHIRGGQITDFNAGIAMLDTNKSHVNGMTLLRHRHGLGMVRSHDNHINGNTSIGNQVHGMFLIDSNRNRFNGNVATSNITGFRVGVFGRFNGGSDNLFTSNVLSSNSFVGLMFDGANNNNTARGNTANGNLFGLIMNQGANNLIQGNTANDNAAAGISVGFFDTIDETFIPGTVIQGNTALNNPPFPGGATSPPVPADLIDWRLFNVGVSQVKWKSNTFVTDSEGDGPGAGWIR